MSTTTMKVMFLIVIAIVIVIGISSINNNNHQQQEASNFNDHEKVNKPIIELPSKRVSRFLIESNVHGRILKPADHCHKDYEVCQIEYGTNSTCCGNKCFDLAVDKSNCGACHKKCKYTESCCGGKCVDLYYDKNHCGSCSNKCLPGQYCIYGMCDYA